MCYSAQVWQAYQDYVRRFGAHISIREFVEVYASRVKGAKIKTTKAMDDAFLQANSDETREIAAAIGTWNTQQVTELEQLLFQQRKRLADAERILRNKSTKKAQNDVRIAGNKIDWAKGKLGDLKRTTAEDRDTRIFPGVYAPVMIVENGRRVIKPMRYQCRPAGKPAFYDTKYPCSYNARRDNVEGRELAEGESDENIVLEFRPQPRQDMFIACLYSHWQQEGEELWSFAAITDEPPAEVAAAGHDRCIIAIKKEYVAAWLNLNPKDLNALKAILDDPERPYYEHRKAA